MTIFGKPEETLWEQMMVTSLSLQQPWGSSSVSVTASNFMNDASKNRVTLFVNANVRIVRGLSVSFLATSPGYETRSSCRDGTRLTKKSCCGNETCRPVSTIE